jgi:hypothetical protein
MDKNCQRMEDGGFLGLRPAGSMALTVASTYFGLV